MIVEGKYAMQESIFYGTHTGPLGNIPATGRTVEFPFMTAYLIENGEIVWGHLYYDSTTLLRQLGVIE
jgi:predicted ester cyclase